MATPAEQIADAVRALEALLTDPEAAQKLDARTKTALAVALPGIRSAENIRTATARSGIRIAEQREKEGLRLSRDRTRSELANITRLEKNLQTAAKRFVESGSAQSTQPALRLAADNFIRIGGSTAVAQGIVNEANISRRLKFQEPALKRIRERAEQRITRRKELPARQLAAGQEARRARLGILGLGESTKVPGGGTLGDLVTSGKGFREAATAAAGKAQKRRSFRRGGLIGGAALIGIPLLLQAIRGGEKQPGSELPPEVQLQLTQALLGGGQGGRAVDPALSTGRNLRNVFQLLQILKTLRDMQGLTQQPQAGGLV